ncbi:MAG: hypothetical protein KGL92_03365 [Gammaproteobacteria bacterium]|nr:hypothetical protein [Gammaproteobacteria bacterium]
MNRFISAAAVLGCAGACVTAAQAAPTAATVSCIGNTTATPIRLSLVDYQLDLASLTTNIGSQSSGAGAGKITFQPFVADAVIDQNLIPMFSQLTRGLAYSSCTIDFGGHTGLTATLKLVELTDLKVVSDDRDAAGGHDGGAAFDRPPVARVTFMYGAIRLSDASGATESVSAL